MGNQVLNKIDRDKLYDYYVNQGWSQAKCAEYFGVRQSQISKLMKKLDIQTRTISESHQSNLLIDITDEMYQILDGAMLGDGYLGISKNGVNAFFRYCSKSYQHVEYVTRKFMKYGNISEADRYDKRTGKYNHTVSYYSHASPTFTQVQNRWYVDRIKHIPKDLVLTPLVCKIWYIGDGSLRNSNRSNTQDIVFATNCFELNEIETIIIPQLEQFEAKIYPIGKGQYTVRIGKKKNVRKFLEYIGECPFDDYAYKWDVKDNIKAGAGQSLYFDDDREVIFLYESGLSMAAVGKVLGCSASNIRYVLKKNSIETRPRNVVLTDYLNWTQDILDEFEEKYKIDAIKKYLNAPRYDAVEEALKGIV